MKAISALPPPAYFHRVSKCGNEFRYVVFKVEDNVISPVWHERSFSNRWNASSCAKDRIEQLRRMK